MRRTFVLMTLLALLAVGFATGIGLIVAIGPQNAFVLRQGIRREHVAVVVTVCALADIALIALGTAGIGIVFERAPWIVQIMRWGGVAYLVWFAYTSIRAAFGHDESLDPSLAPNAENDGDARGRDDAGAGAGVDAGVAGVAGGTVATSAAEDRPGTATAGRAGTASDGQATTSHDTSTRSAGEGQVLVRSAGSIAVATAALTFLNPHVYLDTVVMLGTIANQHEPRWVFAGGAMLGSLVWFAGLGWGAHLLAPVLRSPRVWRAIDLGIAAVMLLVAAKLAFAF